MLWLGKALYSGRVSIYQRPPIVETRERFGDCEGDTREGKKGCGHHATHVELREQVFCGRKAFRQEGSNNDAGNNDLILAASEGSKADADRR
jgi:IS30 family transposase